ncbi:Type 1 glutamine amidotransferase-like domain-containing protein [Thalassiella azotivora]
MTTTLVGGGVDTLSTAGLLRPFVDEAAARGRGHLGRVSTRIGVVLVDEHGSADHFLPHYARALRDASPDAELAVVPIPLRVGSPADPVVLDDVDGLVVAGGPTPAYLDGLLPVAARLRDLVGDGLPYLGLSAGAMVAARTALVGGYRLGGTAVCPREWSEGLDEVTCRPGLGLVDVTVDVHTAQAGTLGRATALVASGAVRAAVGIDEDTCVRVGRPGEPPTTWQTSGSGSLWLVERSGGGKAAVRRRSER